MPLNDKGKNGACDGVKALITHIGIGSLSDPGTGTNANAVEATGGSPAYARQAVTWGTSATGQVTNTNAMTFDVPPGTYGFYLGFSALTGNTGTYAAYFPFGGTAKGFGTVDTAGVTANAVQSAGHGLANGDRLMVFNVFAESAPAGLTEGTIYHVVGATTDTFQVSLTAGGAAVDITGTGELFFQKVVAETFGGQGQIVLGIGQLVLDGTTM